MQLSVSGKQVDVGEALRSHVEERLIAAISKHFDRAIEAQVQFSREGHSIRTDISVHAGSGIQLRGHATADDIWISFDQASDRVVKRLRRFKRRLIDHHQHPATPETPETTARQMVLAGPGDEEESEDGEDGEGEAPDTGAPVTIAETTTTIHTLTVADAVMRMELAELPVLMFRNGAHGGLNVVYRRDDGNIGWIDPHHLQGGLGSGGGD
jgi:ribosomal subunit interface protein